MSQQTEQATTERMGVDARASLRRAPKIGDRVTYTPPMGSHRTTPCTGTVRAIYRAYAYEGESRTGKLLPEREWSVGVEVDAPLPHWWAYVGTNRFAPSVKDLSRAALAPFSEAGR